MKQITLFGLGEAGTLFATDLVAAGIAVHAYDPAAVATPTGVIRHDNPATAVAGAEVIIAVTAAADAMTTLNQAFTDIPATALYADFSTASPGLKQQLAERAATRQIAFADVALLAVVPGKGIRTTALAAGSGATRFVEIFSRLGMPVEALGPRAGDAAARKLLRSIFMKGLAAVTIEALKAAQQTGLSEWLWDNISGEIEQADRQLLHRLVSGTGPHAQRRLHEMEACQALLEERQITPVMTKATVASLQDVLEHGLPEIPGQSRL